MDLQYLKYGSTKNLENARTMCLITPEQFALLPNGVTLTNLLGEQKIKGRDPINDEASGGFMSVGFLE